MDPPTEGDESDDDIKVEDHGVTQVKRLPITMIVFLVGSAVSWHVDVDSSADVGAKVCLFVR